MERLLRHATSRRQTRKQEPKVWRREFHMRSMGEKAGSEQDNLAAALWTDEKYLK